MGLEGKTWVWVRINLVILVKWLNLSDSSSHFQKAGGRGRGRVGNHSAHLKMLWWIYQLIGVVQWAQDLVPTKCLKNRAKHHYHFFSLSSQPQLGCANLSFTHFHIIHSGPCCPLLCGCFCWRRFSSTLHLPPIFTKACSGVSFAPSPVPMDR